METLIGEITHYYSKIGVAIVKLKAGIKVGDRLHYKGASTDFEETVESMQIMHKNVEAAKKGEEVGIKVRERVREGDEVYKVE